MRKCGTCAHQADGVGCSDCDPTHGENYTPKKAVVQAASKDEPEEESLEEEE